MIAQQAEAAWRAQCPLQTCVTGQVYYDPHYIGFNNQTFTVQPLTDAILFKNLSMGLEIHARHGGVNMYPGAPTVVNALAIKVGEHKIQYNGASHSFSLNGQVLQIVNGAAVVGFVPAQNNSTPRADALIVLSNESMFSMYIHNGAKLTVYNARGYNLNVTLTLPRTDAVNAEPSLLGRLNGGHGQNIPAKGIFV